LRRGQDGFTLIEILIGLILLSVGILAIAGMQVTAMRGNFSSSNLTQASILAQDQLEALRGRDFNHADLDAGKHAPVAVGGTIFTREYIVAWPTASMKTITVTIRWRDNANRSISFTTVKSL
jgi:prepilin-type N-terminal cleavage/methylation domain-containing protein